MPDPLKSTIKLQEESTADLEIKDAQIIFQSVWGELENQLGKEGLRFPNEIIWLGGAPGSGKGTNTPYILTARGITAPPIVVSKLLISPEARKIKDSGNMVGDREVINLLLHELLNTKYQNGVVVDGFPRTKVQVECLKLFYDRIIELLETFRDTPLADCFERPRFHLVLLFVDQKISVDRQLHRGREVRSHNNKVIESGVGHPIEERTTDYSEVAALKRYGVFKQTTYEALQSLRQIFHYHFIDASGSLQDVQENISKEFEYQSSLELDPATFDRIRNIPLASQIIQHARQELVKRLDSYEKDHRTLFQQVVTIIEIKFMPIIRHHAISGLTLINSEDPIFDNHVALAILIDVLCERGYRVVIDLHKEDVPHELDPKTNLIFCRQKRVYRIQIRFEGSQIRRGLPQFRTTSESNRIDSDYI